MEARTNHERLTCHTKRLQFSVTYNLCASLKVCCAELECEIERRPTTLEKLPARRAWIFFPAEVEIGKKKQAKNRKRQNENESQGEIPHDEIPSNP